MTGGENLRLKDIARDVFFIPENKKINKLFHQFKKEQLNIAVVLDEYGGLSGIVSREDVIEELLGELWDENEAAESEKITKTGSRNFRIQGDTSLHQVHDALDLEFNYHKNIQTIAGYMTDILDRLPSEGEEITIQGAILKVEQLEKNRIKSIACELVPEDDGDEKK